MSDLDTLRWGDTQNLDFTGASIETFPMVTKQMVAARWRRPLTWVLNVVIIPNLPNETGKLLLDVAITQGVGGGLITAHKQYTIAPVLGVYPPIYDSFQIAAQDIQISATLSALGLLVGGEESVQVGFFVAPVTEPHSMATMLDHHERRDPEPRWMHTNPATPFPGDVSDPVRAPGGLYYQNPNGVQRR